MKAKCDNIWWKVSTDAKVIELYGIKCLPVTQCEIKGKWVNAPAGTVIPVSAIVAIIK